MAAGFDRARGAYIVPMDADLQNDPDDIPLLLDRLERGLRRRLRLAQGPPGQGAHPPAAVARSPTGSSAGSAACRLHDYGCTLKAYRREVLEPVRLYGEMHRFIPIYAKWSGARITEQVVRHHPRIEGKSKYGLGAHAEGAARPDRP